MTISNSHKVEGASTSALATVDKVDAFARKLYRHARNAGPDFEGVAPVVRDLYSVLKHLKVEAEDPASLLNSDKSGVHLRQLTPIIEDTEFTLRQLDTVLENYFNCGVNGSGKKSDGDRTALVNEADKCWTMGDNMGQKKVDLIRNKLDHEKLRIDMFLDAIQPHNPSKSHQNTVSPSIGSDDLPLLPAYPALAELSEEIMGGSDIDNEKFFPSVNMERLGYAEYAPQRTVQPPRGIGISYDHVSSGKPASGSMALVSTKELIGSRDMSNLANAVESWQLGPSPPHKHWPPVDSGSRTSPSGGRHSGMSPSAPAREPVNQKPARLRPDSRGREIPSDATWTRIPRRLVSPEVLAREGLRYEAKPDFVAILGELKKEEVADLATKSFEVRRERQRALTHGTNAPMQSRFDKREQRSSDRSYPDEFRHWNFVDSRQDRNGGPVHVMESHHRHRANNAASSIGELWDSSDDESREDADEARAATARFSSSYPPSRPHSSQYHRASSPRSGARNGVASISHDGYEKGTRAYPFIVPPPARDGDGNGKPSPSATVKPKPILKNKNDDPHVRFDPEPQVLNDSSNSASQQSLSRVDRGKEANEYEYRERDRGKSHDRERERRYHLDVYQNREHHRDRNGDRSRDREREYRHGSRNRGERRYYITSGRRDDRDHQYRHQSHDRGRGRDRDQDRSKDRGRATRKKSRSDAYRSSGISSAAAGLMSILTEAAASL